MLLTATSPEIIAFVAGVQALQNKWQSPELAGRPEFHTTVVVEQGPRRLRIVKAEGTRSRSVHCFIDRTNGDILKAAGWKAPAPNGKRGSVLADDRGLSCVNDHGTISRR